MLSMRLKYRVHAQYALKIIESVLSMRLKALSACCSSGQYDFCRKYIKSKESANGPKIHSIIKFVNCSVPTF
jgi:hypothetical protein